LTCCWLWDSAEVSYTVSGIDGAGDGAREVACWSI
jgi:hypothetical protein